MQKLPKGVRAIPHANPVRYGWRFRMGGERFVSRGRGFQTPAEAATDMARAQAAHGAVLAFADHPEASKNMDLTQKPTVLAITLAPPEPKWFAAFRVDYNHHDPDPPCPEWPGFWQHVMEVTGDDMYAYVSIARKLGFL